MSSSTSILQGPDTANEHQRLYSIAYGLSIFTILYNVAEGIIATYFGYQDETLALFGFGMDSFIESMSGVGIAHMIIRIRQNNNVIRDDFERLALKITGWAFYLLAAGLFVSGIINLITDHRPVTTFWGVVISLISIIIMLGLIYGKQKVGRALDSEPILADANCTKVCIYMSVILLVSSGLYEWFRLPHIDTLATFGLVFFSAREGKECFEKAASERYCGCEGDVH